MTGQPQYFQKSERLIDVVIIRSLAIVMVVFFHAYYMMMVQGHFPASAQTYHNIYYNLNCLILQFRMPLFVMISGYLFSYLENERGKYKGFKALLANKFKRLIIPFFVFATVFMLSINDFSLRPYYTWGYSHLWFIPMLFWCFIFTRLQALLPWSKSRYWKAGLLAVAFFLTFGFSADTKFLGITNFVVWYFWFFFGYQLLLHRERIYSTINQHKVLISILLVALFAIGAYLKCTVLQSDNIRTWYTEVGNIAIVILVWYWINYLIFSNLLRRGG